MYFFDVLTIVLSTTASRSVGDFFFFFFFPELVSRAIAN